MTLLDQPHHDPSERYVSNPTPAPGETIEVELIVPRGDVGAAWLRTIHDGEGTFVAGTRHQTTGSGDRWTFQLTCHNPTVRYRFWLDTPKGPQWLNGTGLVDHDPTDHFDFALTTDGGAPDWVPRTVWYQIFPDRFARSGVDRELPAWAQPAAWDDAIPVGPDAMTQIFGGDLDGIAEHLDHLVDLGVGGIYLTPIFPSRSNHRYDATTFDRVDPILGGDDALVRLRQACTERGLRLICDITLNHTGDAHDWFVAAQADATGPEADFYYFTEHPDDYEAWLGVRSLPKLDHGSTELARRLHDGANSAMGRLLEAPFAIDGWRVDVANMTGRFGLHDHNRSVRTAARRTVDSAGDAWLVAENFFDPSGDVDGPGWHGWMNYIGVARPILSWLGDAELLEAMSPGPGQDQRSGQQVARAMDDVRASVPWSFTIGSMALLASHDTARWRTMVPNTALAEVGFGLLMTLPGSPCFFYGDEIGLTGEDNEQARTPMPWDAQEDWDIALMDQYRALVTLRSGSDALAVGGLRWVEREADALAFIRESRNERLLVRATRSNAPALELTAAVIDGAPEVLYGSPKITIRAESVEIDHSGAAVSIVRIG